MGHSVVVETEAGEIESPAGPWWMFLVTGILSILVALVVLRFDAASVTTVGLLVGFVFLWLGLVDLFAAFVDRRGRWLHGILGAILVIGGVVAIVNPAGTFFALSQIVGFLLVLMGTLRIVEAFMVKDEYDLWWLVLVTGILMVLLGFWAGGRFFAGASLILVWVGFSLLIRGFGQIMLAFSLRRLDRDAR
jgi:uncharacterized membrane protein HdeD (DUF308 family)